MNQIIGPETISNGVVYSLSHNDKAAEIVKSIPGLLDVIIQTVQDAVNDDVLQRTRLNKHNELDVALIHVKKSGTFVLQMGSDLVTRLEYGSNNPSNGNLLLKNTQFLQTLQDTYEHSFAVHTARIYGMALNVVPPLQQQQQQHQQVKKNGREGWLFVTISQRLTILSWDQWPTFYQNSAEALIQEVLLSLQSLIDHGVIMTDPSPANIALGVYGDILFFDLEEACSINIPALCYVKRNRTIGYDAPENYDTWNIPKKDLRVVKIAHENFLRKEYSTSLEAVKRAATAAGFGVSNPRAHLATLLFGVGAALYHVITNVHPRYMLTLDPRDHKPSIRPRLTERVCKLLHNIMHCDPNERIVRVVGNRTGPFMLQHDIVNHNTSNQVDFTNTVQLLLPDPYALPMPNHEEQATQQQPYRNKRRHATMPLVAPKKQKQKHGKDRTLPKSVRKKSKPDACTSCIRCSGKKRNGTQCQRTKVFDIDSKKLGTTKWYCHQHSHQK